MGIFLRLLLCLCVAQMTHASNLGISRNRANLTWRNSLSSKADLEQFLKGSEQMVRETITIGLMSVLLGPDTMGDLSLLEFLQALQRLPRKRYGVMLVIPNAALYVMALPLFQQFDGSNWITLTFEIMRGPNGAHPPFTAQALSLVLTQSPLPRGFHLCLKMTTGDVGPEKGYTQANIFEFVTAVGFVAVAKIDMETEWDAYHVSHTQGMDTMPKLGSLGIIYFRCSAQMQDDVDVPGFMKMFKKFSQYSSYLNMPRPLQERILDYDKPKTRPSQAGNNRVGLCFILCLGLLGMMVREGITEYF